MSQQLTYPASKRSEIFEQMHESQNWHVVDHQGWHLPGTKDSHDWCGKWSAKGCLNVLAHKGTDAEGKGFVKTFQKSCYRADCEVCHKKWNARESNKATRRIEKYESQSKRRAKHIIVSVPYWLYGKSKKELAKHCYKILKDVGCIGGTSIFHPFRYNKDAKQWYYSPHFHIIGFGWIDNVTENYNRNGFVVKNKGFRDSVFSTFYYQLSHAGIKKRNHTLVWFGDLSYSKLKLEKDESEANFCPYCEAKLQEVEPFGLFGHKPPDLDVELLVDVIGWRYVEQKGFVSELTKDEKRDFALKQELYYANKGISCYGFTNKTIG